MYPTLSTIVLNIKDNFVNTYFICLFHGLNAFNPFCWEDSYFVLLSLIRTIGFAEGTFARNSKINASIILLFARLFVPLTFGRRYCRSDFLK